MHKAVKQSGGLEASPRVRTAPGSVTHDHPSSVQDPHGRLFFRDGDLYRGLYPESADFYRRVLALPAVRGLMDRGLLIRSEFSSVTLDNFPLVVEHPTLPFVTYPFEWCGDMLRDAGLLVLDIMEALAASGLTLRDPSPWDVLFVGSEPMFVDITAIRPISAARQWSDCDRFRRGFVYPLHMMSGRRERVARWLLHDPGQGVSPGDFARMYPFAFSRWQLKQWLAGVRPRRGSDPGPETRDAKRPTRDALRSHQRALRLLRSEVCEARPHSGATVWSKYYEEHADIRFPGSARGPDWNAKHRTVCDLLERLQPAAVNSFGCNRGWYEQQAARLGARVVCSDLDGKAIAGLYADARENHLHLQPLILDVLNPSPGLGVRNTQWAPAAERLHCDLVMALALTHHLTLEHRVGFEEVVASLSAFADRWLLVEFVPGADAHLARWSPVVPEWYSLDRFQTTLLGHYRTVTRFDSHPSPRVLLLCEK